MTATTLLAIISPADVLPVAVSVGEEQSPSTRQAVDAEVETMLKGAYQRVVG
jgi:small neutral amino acid transporter SnatA (MarC family)